MPDAQMWVAGFSGGLAGAFFSNVLIYIKYLWNRPRLEVVFTSQVSGCTVDNVRYQNGGRGRYLRLRVHNPGRSAAKDVQILAHSLSIKSSQHTIYEEEIINFEWSARGGLKANIPSSTHLFADICYCVYGGESEQQLHFAAPAGWTRFQNDSVNHDGKMSFEIKITASNAKTQSKTITFDFHKSAQSLKIVD